MESSLSLSSLGMLDGIWSASVVYGKRKNSRSDM